MKTTRSRVPWRFTPLLAAVALVAALASTSSGAALASYRAKVAKPRGTATVAQLFGPDYIFPFFSPVYATIANEDFQAALYRPLVSVPSNSGQEAVNEEVSAAQSERFTNGGKSVVITLKDWKWSNGEPLQAKDVVFWLNMMREEKDDYGLYIPGEIPDNIVSYRTTGTRSLVITFNRRYSQSFLLLDQLSEITPMPLAWDLTGKGRPGDCVANRAACAAVYNYLASQSKTPSTFASNPLWKIVDGPWSLKSFSSDGSFTIVPNARYSGSPKPRLAAVRYETFTSDTSEYNVLRSNHSLDVGFLPTPDLPRKPANKNVGPNPVSGYSLVPTTFWGAIALPLNFNNPKVGRIFRQTYVRQAMQSTVDQRGMIQAFLSGYGFVQPGPVSSEPPNSWQSRVDKHGGPWPFDLAKAKAILKSHGWKVVPGGTDSCIRPGTGASDCGAGIAAGTKLEFSAIYIDTPTWVGQSMAQWKSDASKVGIQLSLTSGPFSTVYGETTRCEPSQAACSWQISNFDGIENYAYPVGALFFSSDGALDYGSYSSAKANALINQTIIDSSPAAMQQYDYYLADQVPMIWFPDPVDNTDEIINTLGGTTAARHGGEAWSLTPPEYWYLKK